MREPVVSIICPTYDNADMIAGTISSLMIQNFPDFELIIVSDGAGDKTTDEVLCFKDSRIIYRIIEHGNDYGINALNHGFALARGKYLTMCSSDNIYTTNFLRTLLEGLDSSDADFVYANFFQLEKEKGVMSEFGRPSLLNGSFDISYLAIGYTAGICFMYTREVWDKFGPYRVSSNADYDFMARAAIGGVKFAYIDSILGANVIHPRQTSETSRNYEEETRIRLMVCDHMIKNKIPGGVEIKKMVLNNQRKYRERGEKK